MIIWSAFSEKPDAVYLDIAHGKVSIILCADDMVLQGMIGFYQEEKLSVKDALFLECVLVN